MNILVIGPGGSTPVQIYRGHGVMEKLRQIDPTINITKPLSRDMSENLLSADVVYCLRQSLPRDLEIITTAKAMGVPVWYDADDDYFNVTPDSPVYASYQNEQVRDTIVKFLQGADIVTVSTEDLRQKYKFYRHGKPLEVVNNALDDYAFKDWNVYPTEKPEKVIAWRGGVTHQADLASHADQFWEFFDKSDKDWKAHFIGFYPLMIEEGLDWCPKDYVGRMIVDEYDPRYYSYVRRLRDNVKPWAMVVPLRDNPFNRSKSNIAALEAVYAGSIPIVPNWEEWQFDGAIKYDRREDLGKLMLKVSRMNENTRRELWQANLKTIREKYLLSNVNRQRIKILKDLTGKD